MQQNYNHNNNRDPGRRDGISKGEEASNVDASGNGGPSSLGRANLCSRVKALGLGTGHVRHTISKPGIYQYHKKKPLRSFGEPGNPPRLSLSKVYLTVIRIWKRKEADS